MEMNEKIRLRRLRKTDLIRQLAAETNVNVNDLVYPIFIKEGRKIKEEITNMPNIYRYSIDNLDAEIEEIKSLGIKTIILFGIPKFKNESGDGAYIKQGIIQKTVRHLREVTNDLTIITDVCLCQYINHGHCGVIKNDKILNDASLSILSKIALSHAEEGADLLMVKPGLYSLDLIQPINNLTGLMVGAYQVSGEYAGINLASENNLLKLNEGLYESWHVMKRAGAQFIITYGARKSKELGFSVK